MVLFSKIPTFFYYLEIFLNLVLRCSLRKRLVSVELQMVLSVSWVNYLQVPVTYVGYHYSSDTLDVNNELLSAMTEQFDEGAFDAVVYSAYDSYRGALTQVNFLRTQVPELVNVLLTKGYELLHLFVGDDDGDIVPKAVGAGVILQVAEPALEFPNAALLAVHEQQIVYCRGKG
jgi:hypothetical protein